MTESTNGAWSGAVAVIGMSARFPGAPDAAAFWANLRDGIESVTRFEGDGLRAAGVDADLLRDDNYVRAAAVLDGIEWFDAEFFGFRERDAETLDPQHRIFLECAWEALEDAGYRTSGNGPTIGVFAGTSISSYLLFNLAHRLDTSGADFNLATLIGNDKDYLPTMTAYKLDLRGPAYAVQTACSSSLVAVHQACQALINGECDMALAGGVTVRIPHRVGYWHQGGSMLSPDGHCRAFDAAAGGTVPGSGAGIVVLKRLPDALRDRDCIRAVVLGSAINNDGAIKVGFTAPNVEGQATVTATAHAVAGIDPRTISYIEAHGTGTRLGDPIEIEALTKAFGPSPDPQFCAIGSVKTNIGHLECAAGVAGLIKTVLALQHKQIPPSLHFRSPNEQIAFARSPVYVNSRLADWNEPFPRRAGVSSFGFGGTNCHVVLEEAPLFEAPPPRLDRTPHILTLSAPSEPALADLSARYIEFLRGVSPSNVPDICYTANVGRKTFAWRKTAIGASGEELADALHTAPATQAGKRPPIAFLFPGAAPQSLELARHLCETQPSFRETLRRCDELLRGRFDCALLPLSADAFGEKQGEAIHVAIQYAMAELWASWGVRPALMMGHGSGEYAAACVAGVFGLEEGFRLAARRAQLENVASYSDPCVPIASSRTGAFLSQDEAATHYRAAHNSSPQRLAEAFQTLVDAGCRAFVEIDSGAALCDVGRSTITRAGLAWLPTARAETDWRDLLSTVAALFGLGVDIDWDGFHRDSPGRRVPIPTYPFQRKRYWVDPSARERAPREERRATHPLLGEQWPLATGQRVFQARVSPEAPPFLADHRVRGTVVFPMSAYLEAALASATHLLGNAPARVDALDIDAPLVLSDGETSLIQVVLTPGSAAGEATFDLFRRADESDSWQRHATARLRAGTAPTSIDVSLDRMRTACHEQVPVSDFYAALRAAGMEYGQGFRRVRQLWRGEECALARVEGEAGTSEPIDYRFHPALADACLQAAGALIDAQADGEPWLPVRLASVFLGRRCPATLWAAAVVRRRSASAIAADIVVFDDSERVVAEFQGLSFRRARAQPPAARHTYEISWRRLDASERSPMCSAGTWLIFDEERGLGASVAERLAASGAQCIIVRPGERFERDALARYRIRLDERSDFDRLIAETTAEPLAGAIHLWSLPTSEVDLAAARQPPGCGSTLLLGQSLLDARRRDGFRVWLVTSGAQRVDPADTAFAPLQASTWGLGRVLANEHPELGCVLVDIEPDDAETSARMLVEDCLTEHPEAELAYRRDERFMPRLVRRTRRPLPDGPYRLPLPDEGALANLRCIPAEAPVPGPGEVGIRVRATGLNFRDVLNALGLYPAADPLGSDCAGEIYAVGPGVVALTVGDQVVAVARGSFASHAIAPADFVVPIKAGVAFERAAAAPTALLTAHHALFSVGGLTQEDTVLIHAGAGGVGLAAVRIALAVGARVFATAGSPAKRRYLSNLGVARALDSRSLDFRAEVLQATGGQGVDLVLNSLTGPFIPASLSTMRAGGRFLEIGRIGIWDSVRVADEYPHVAYHGIQLGELMQSSRAALSSLMREVLDTHVQSGREPLPMRVFSMEGVSDAFRYMQGARHIGKIVVTHPREIRADATYLIVGGFGALGLQLARALADRGARSLVLAGRRPPSPHAMESVASLRGRGVRVDCRIADVTKPDDVVRLVESPADAPPLRGIAHAAGVLDDCAWAGLTADRLAAAMAPKVAGAWNLHVASKGVPLDFFVLYSSAAALFGPPGQASSAAANSVLDALSHYRHARGLPCLSVNWGPWRAGMSVSAGTVGTVSWSDLGLSLIEADQGQALLDRLLLGGVPQAAVILADWPRFLDRFAGGRRPSLLEELGGSERITQTPTQTRNLRRDVESLPAASRQSALRDEIRSVALQVFGQHPPQPLQDDVSLIEFGFDSLMTVELRNALSGLTGARLPSTLIFDYPTIEELSVYLSRDVFHWIAAPAPRETERAQRAEPDEPVNIDELSEDQLAEWVVRETDKWSRRQLELTDSGARPNEGT